MSLGSRQREFTSKIAELILWAYDHGYQLSLGDAYRDPRVFGNVGDKQGYGHPRSYHKSRLAVDLNLFRDGRYLSSTESHRTLGEKWESMGGTWGGRFGASGGDGNHYSWGEGRG